MAAVEEVSEALNLPLDPWLCITGEECKSELMCAFEDHFKPYMRMPDSVKYISALENKLFRLKGGCGSLTGKGMVESLTRSKSDAMANFLRGTTNFDGAVDASLNEPAAINCRETSSIPISSIITTRLHPEKQALNAEETVYLISADQLNRTNSADVS